MRVQVTRVKCRRQTRSEFEIKIESLVSTNFLPYLFNVSPTGVVVSENDDDTKGGLVFLSLQVEYFLIYFIGVK
jgi:hypothetical protein